MEVKGWHNDYFTKSYFEEYEDPEEPNEIFNFVRKEAIEKATEFFGTSDFRKILVISEFRPGQREECMEIVKKGRVDEVLEFHDILSFVVDRVEPNKNYRDSEFLQTVRLLKGYGFLKPDEA